MDEELKGNSFKQKAEIVSESEVVKSKMKGGVKPKKKSVGKILAENFINNDMETIKTHIIFDVVFPTIRDLMFNGFSTFLDMFLYGNNGGAPKQNNRGYGPRTVVSSNTNYNAISNHRSNNRIYASGGRPQPCDDIFFEERGDAITVLDELTEHIDKYGYVSAYDYYDYAGLTCDYTLKNWGWYDIGSASVSRTSAGDYVINMPKMVVIK